MVIHLILWPKDGDISYWRSTLPPKTFGKHVNYILACEATGRQAILLVPEERGRLNKKVDLRFSAKDRGAIKLLRQIPSRKRSAYIIQTVRKHLDRHYQLGEEWERTLYEEEHQFDDCTFNNR